jgi:hypothetical protein
MRVKAQNRARANLSFPVSTRAVRRLAGTPFPAAPLTQCPQRARFPPNAAL